MEVERRLGLGVFIGSVFALIHGTEWLYTEVGGGLGVGDSK